MIEQLGSLQVSDQREKVGKRRGEKREGKEEAALLFSLKSHIVTPATFYSFEESLWPTLRGRRISLPLLRGRVSENY